MGRGRGRGGGGKQPRRAIAKGYTVLSVAGCLTNYFVKAGQGHTVFRRDCASYSTFPFLSLSLWRGDSLTCNIVDWNVKPQTHFSQSLFLVRRLDMPAISSNAHP